MTDSLISSSPELQTPQGNWSDRVARKTVLSILRGFSGDPLTIRYPEGTEETVGEVAGDKHPAVLDISSHGFFKRVLWHGEIGFGEGYMEGDWTTPDLPHLLATLINNLDSIPEMSGNEQKSLKFHLLSSLNKFAHWRRRNTRSNSRRNIQEHYDLSNDFYKLWLDETMTYSSAWFRDQESLEEAQKNKYQRLCEKLRLKPGMRVLEIGCGWGGFSLYAARNYGVNITAITISKAQQEIARQRVKEAGLEEMIDVRLVDYRDVKGDFDAIASIEMLEAVGHEYLKTFFRQCHALLKPEGRVGLQVIVCPDSRYKMMRRSVDWIKKHIFPGGQLPSIKALLDSANSTGDLYLQHLENFGLHYARTLEIWRDQFNEQKEAVSSLGFDDRFMRKWNYYLAYCQAAFATRNINVSQMILTRPNNTGFVLEG